MRKVGLVYNSIYLEHDTGGGHPERKSRLEAIIRQLEKDKLLAKLIKIEPIKASVEWIKEIHEPLYIEKLKTVCQEGHNYIDVQDCPICKMTYDVALWATGGLLSAVDSVMEGIVDSAFCAVRPPGHHAERNHAMGFCFFNNVAIAARYLQKKHNLKKIFILDWDVHHGNGTQHSFERDQSVFYCSLHQDPTSCYPGTGYSSETGFDDGKGYTLNCPIPPSSGDDFYLNEFANKVLPAMRDFEPDFILISAGFDAHKDDPLAGLNLTEEAFVQMTSQIVQLGDDLNHRRIVSVLEGGYNLIALGKSVSEHINALL